MNSITALRRKEKGICVKDRFTIAASSIRKFGEVVEVYWHNQEPFDEKLHGSWTGDLAGMTDLRKWLKKNKPDGRTITLYCDGDYRDVIYL